MISNAFKSAYTNQVNAKNQTASNISSGMKSAATGILGVTAFTGGLGEGMFTTASEYAFANKVGGVGGAIMLASIKEKEENAKEQKRIQERLAGKEPKFTSSEIANTISSNLGDNPINNTAKKQLSTVFEKLTEMKEKGIINKKGMIETNMGEIDPNSELGKKLVQGEWKNDNDR